MFEWLWGLLGIQSVDSPDEFCDCPDCVGELGGNDSYDDDMSEFDPDQVYSDFD